MNPLLYAMVLMVGNGSVVHEGGSWDERVSNGGCGVVGQGDSSVYDGGGVWG